jgi:hypothetical protein
MEIMEIISIIAIFLGPTIAIVISAILNQSYLNKQVKTNIFYALMQNRGFPFPPQFYTALNSINVAFYNDREVIHAWQEFRNYIASNPEKDKVILNNEDSNWNKEKEDHFYNLLIKMAKSLKYKFDEKDIKNTSYIPQEVIKNYELNNNINNLVKEMKKVFSTIAISQASEQEGKNKTDD